MPVTSNPLTVLALSEKFSGGKTGSTGTGLVSRLLHCNSRKQRKMRVIRMVYLPEKEAALLPPLL
jgi:hypothetical protein